MPCSEESGFSNCFFCRSTSENSGFWHFFGDVVLLSYPGQDARFGSCSLGSCFYAGERPGVSSGGLALSPFTCLLCLHLMFAFWPADRSPLWSSPSPAVDLAGLGPLFLLGPLPGLPRAARRWAQSLTVGLESPITGSRHSAFCFRDGLVSSPGAHLPFVTCPSWDTRFRLLGLPHPAARLVWS